MDSDRCPFHCLFVLVRRERRALSASQKRKRTPLGYIRTQGYSSLVRCDGFLPWPGLCRDSSLKCRGRGRGDGSLVTGLERRPSTDRPSHLCPPFLVSWTGGSGGSRGMSGWAGGRRAAGDAALTSRRYHGRHQLSVHQLCCLLCLSSQEFIDIFTGCVNFSTDLLTIRGLLAGLCWPSGLDYRHRKLWTRQLVDEGIHLFLGA